MKGIFAALAAVALSGCAMLDDPYNLKVSVNPLNWVEIHYYNANREPVARTNLRLTGSGHVEVKSGTSRLVSDSFAKDSAEKSWDDVRSAAFEVDKKHVRDVFQMLVNGGLFDREKSGRSTDKPSPGRFVAVRAAIDGKTFSEPMNIFEKDPEFAELLLSVVQEFRAVRLGGRPKRDQQRLRESKGEAPRDLKSFHDSQFGGEDKDRRKGRR